MGSPIVKLFANECEIEIDFSFHFNYVYWNHTNLFHTSKLNEWVHLKLKLDDCWDLNEEEKNEMLSCVQMGIHVLMEKSNTEEENVVFTYPYLNYSNNTSVSEIDEEEGFSRKIDEDINASLQQQDLTKEEQTKTWGTFLSLGPSKSNTDGDNIEILSSAQDERKMLGTFLGLGPS